MRPIVTVMPSLPALGRITSITGIGIPIRSVALPRVRICVGIPAWLVCIRLAGVGISVSVPISVPLVGRRLAPPLGGAPCAVVIPSVVIITGERRAREQGGSHRDS